MRVLSSLVICALALLLSACSPASDPGAVESFDQGITNNG